RPVRAKQRIVLPLQGRLSRVIPTQGCGEYALPWAILLRPFGAKISFFHPKNKAFQLCFVKISVNGIVILAKR
ncbi:MAG: hypothetical protein ACRC10_08080, partial [Thermoguttaceae bacterium]